MGAGMQELEQRLQTEVDQRTSECGNLAAEFASQKETADFNLNQDRERMDFLTQNVQKAGDLLMFGIQDVNLKAEELMATASTDFSPNSTASSVSPSAAGDAASP